MNNAPFADYSQLPAADRDAIRRIAEKHRSLREIFDWRKARPQSIAAREPRSQDTRPMAPVRF